MKSVAFIPVRGGSKSIPLKNIKSFCGKPLVYWTIKAACNCKYIDNVYVSTDSKLIKETVERFNNEICSSSFSKVIVIDRSKESATDTASTESAMIEFASKYEFDNIVLIQATSPLLTSNELDKGFETFFEPDIDSVLSVVIQKRFNWKLLENGCAEPLNYDIFNRPRRQDFSGYLVENGAFYITTKANLLKYKNRLSGNIKPVIISEDTFFEIDEPSDWIIMESLMKKRMSKNVFDKSKIKMFLTDCDGCLTDGGMYYSELGDELKKFNTRDGLGFAILKKMGIITGIITGESVSLNQRRAKKLKLDILEEGCNDKLSAIKRLCNDYCISLDNICYVGDDLNDIEVLENVGYPCCPKNAIDDIKNKCLYISRYNGGEGVIRDIVDHLVK